MEVPTDPHHSSGSFAPAKLHNLSGRQWHDEHFGKEEIVKNMTDSSGERDFAGMDLHVKEQNVRILDEIGSLCSECRLDEEEEAKKMEAKHLGRKLAQLVDGMNRAEILRHKTATEEELKMELKKAKEEEQKWAEQNEIWKEKLEELKREKMKEKLAEKDALGEELIPSKIWSERSGTTSNLESIWAADEQMGKTKRLREQLRRTEALKKSIERLQQFKRREKEEQERNSEMEMNNRRIKNDLLLGEQRKMLINRQNSLDSQFGPKSIGQSSTHPTVFEAWKKARETHEKRYRILQDGDEYGRGRGISRMENVIERKRCRKCKKPINVRQFVRQSRNE